MLDVTTRSSDEVLTTTAAIKAVLGTTSTADDALLSDMAARASRRAESYVGYPLSAAAYRETLAGYGSRRLMLSRTPVRAVSAVYTGTDTGSASQILTSEYRLDAAKGFLDRTAGFEWRAPLVPSRFAMNLDDGVPFAGQEEETFLVDYVAGYVRGGMTTDSALWSTEKGTTSTGRTLPEDIEEAVVGRVADLYGGKDGVASRSIGDLSVSYEGDAEGLAGAGRAFAALEPYRRSA